MQEWRVSAFDCQGPAVYRSGDSQRLAAMDLPYAGVESQSLAARDLPYAGVESLRVWLPGTCHMQEWRAKLGRGENGVKLQIMSAADQRCRLATVASWLRS